MAQIRVGHASTIDGLQRMTWVIGGQWKYGDGGHQTNGDGGQWKKGDGGHCTKCDCGGHSGVAS